MTAACVKGHVSVARVLLERGANVAQRGKVSMDAYVRIKVCNVLHTGLREGMREGLET